MRSALVLLGIFLFANAAFAVDATNNATEVMRSGRWLLIEFAAKQQLLYRISSQSTNSGNSFVAFDFVPSEKCSPTPAVMSSTLESYNPAFDKGLVPMSYMPPSHTESTELTKTEMTPGDNVAFFQFKGLTAGLLLKSRDKGSLAVWIPGSGDGTVSRSNNVYFSLEGFTAAYKGAQKRCNDKLEAKAPIAVAYTIFTFKNGQPIGTRKVNTVELRSAGIAMTTAFRNKTPSYGQLVDVADGMTAKDRCFNLYSTRVALASVESGMLDASANAEEFLKHAIASIGDVDSKTQVTCEMR